MAVSLKKIIPLTLLPFSISIYVYAQDVDSGFITGGDDLSFDEQSLYEQDTQGEGAYYGTSPQTVIGRQRRAIRFSPYGEAFATYTDNVNLTPDSQKQDALIFGAEVGVRADSTAERFDASGSASIRYTQAEGQDANILPNAEAGATAELLRNKLFVDGFAQYGLLLNGRDGFLSNSGAESENSFDTIGTVSLSPYWRQRLGNVAVGELRYGYDQTFTSSNNIGEVTNHSYQGTIGTGDRFNRFSLQGSVAHIESETDNNGVGGALVNPTFSQTAYNATAFYSPPSIPNVRFFANGGYDDVSSETAPDDEFSGVHYNGGLEYQPNSRLRLMGLAGRRYNSENYTLEASYNLTEKTVIGATGQVVLLPATGYTSRTAELPGNTTQRLIDQINNGQSIASAIRTQTGFESGRITGVNSTNGNFIVSGNEQNNDAFRSNSIQAFIGTRLGDVAVSLNGGIDSRDYYAVEDEESANINGSLGYQVNRRLFAGMGGYFLNLRSQTEEQEFDQYGLNANLEYLINRHLRAYASYNFNQRKAELNNNEFTENAVTIGINAAF